MKRALLGILSLFTLMTLLSLTAVAEASIIKLNENPKIKIINHFKEPLEFAVTIGPDLVPELDEHFTLNDQESVESSVIASDDPNACEAYISATATSGDHRYAFFGVENQESRAVIHGYMDSGIAYSWKSGVVTFCTHDDYMANGHCE